MIRKILAAMCLISYLFCAGNALAEFEKDAIPTNSGDLVITFIGHGTVMFTYNGMVVHVDPWTKLADYNSLPKADVILVTHEHFDHLDSKAIEQVKKNETAIVANAKAAGQIAGAITMRNGEEKNVKGLDIKAVPAYNLVHKRPDSSPFHPKGNGNGYVVSFGDKRVYIAGDTENVPEMAKLKDIDIAFLPMNLPYTMTPEMVADAAKSFMPGILYPFHFGTTDTGIIKDLLKGSGIEVRIRKMP